MPSFSEWKSSYVSGWKKSFDYKSNSSRIDYISFTLSNIVFIVTLKLLNSILMYLVLLTDPALGFDEWGELLTSAVIVLTKIIPIISLFLIAGYFVSGISLTVRRLRDMGKRWWWVFCSFVPIINFIFEVWLLITPSKKIDQQSI